VASEKQYELVIVISPAVDSQEASTTIENIHGLISSNGGSLISQNAWGMKRLAYPINDFTEGNYFFTEFESDSSTAQVLENALRLSENVIRHLIVMAPVRKETGQKRRP
jgi:small subunit ribosomal protein S6